MAKIFEQSYRVTWVYRSSEKKIYRVTEWDGIWVVFLNHDVIGTFDEFIKALDKVVAEEKLEVTSLYTTPKQTEDDNQEAV